MLELGNALNVQVINSNVTCGGTSGSVTATSLTGISFIKSAENDARSGIALQCRADAEGVGRAGREALRGPESQDGGVAGRRQGVARLQNEVDGVDGRRSPMDQQVARGADGDRDALLETRSRDDYHGCGRGRTRSRGAAVVESGTEQGRESLGGRPRAAYDSGEKPADTCRCCVA